MAHQLHTIWKYLRLCSGGSRMALDTERTECGGCLERWQQQWWWPGEGMKPVVRSRKYVNGTNDVWNAASCSPREAKFLFQKWHAKPHYIVTQTSFGSWQKWISIFLLITMHFLFRQSNRTLTRTHCKEKYITKQNEISMSLVSDFDTSITRKSCNEPIRLRLELAVTVLSSIILYNYTSIQVIFSSDVAYHLMNSASQSSDFIVDFIYGSNQ